MAKIYCMADIHGKYNNLMKLIRLIRKDGGLNFKRGDKLIQLGDRCDRGNDTFRVNNFFYKLEKRYPGQIICLKGNHEDMMLGAALGTGSPDLFIMNGGNSTMKSYKCYSNNVQVLGYKLQDCGHLKWLDAQPMFYETDEYFFSHAPIPIPSARNYAAYGDSFRTDKETLIWSYKGEATERWVDKDPAHGKLCFYGHIHGLKRNGNGEYVAPGIRQYGNAFLLDTGSGCAPKGYLTCLELTEMKAYDSNGNISVSKKVEVEE